MMKRIIALLLLSTGLLLSASCGAEQKMDVEPEPELDDMRAICELSVMDCYYHNVAKYEEEDAGGILLWQRDKKFWIEYGGIVKLGIDASLVNMEISENEITITMPEAKVLSCSVNQDELSEESYIVDKDSVKVKVEDEIKAFEEAQKNLGESAANDKAMLLGAQERAKELLKDYVTNLGEAAGKTYTIKWLYVDAEGNPLNDQNPEQDAEA